MAKLTPIEKLKIIEDDFQKWFRKAYELKDYTDVDIDFLVDNLPRAKLQNREGMIRYHNWKGQLKSFKTTIKIPSHFQTNPKLFIPTLGKYFIDSSKFLYKDQIRYEYFGAPSSSLSNYCQICIYKECGEDLGCFYVRFELEGNLVVTEASYQIYRQLIPLCSNPDMLRPFTSALKKSGRSKFFNYATTTYWSIKKHVHLFIWLFISFVGALLLMALGSGNEPRNKKTIDNAAIGFLIGYIISLLATLRIRENFCSMFDNVLGTLLVGNKDYFNHSEPWHEHFLEWDLSPLHFPIKCHDTESFQNAFVKNDYHQLFFERLEQVVRRMSALGESSDS